MKKYMIPALCFILLCCLGFAFAETALQPEDLMLQADAAAEAREIERYVAKAEFPQRVVHFFPKRRVRQAGQLLRQKLDASKLSVRAHAILTESEGAETVLGRLNAPQLFRRDRLAVDETGGEAGERGLVPACQPQPF